MAQNDTVFTGSIPQLYDEHMGALLFAPYAGIWQSGFPG